jgi:small-conductance mechanosensitive channel
LKRIARAFFSFALLWSAPALGKTPDAAKPAAVAGKPVAAPATPATPVPKANNAAAPKPALAAPEAPIGPDLDKIGAALKEIAASLDKSDLADADLQRLRQRLDPVSASAAAAIDKLTPRLSAVQARLDQLGPKPADDAAPESPSVTAEREDQENALNDAQELLKRARLIAVQAEQTGAVITAKRRALFARSLFEQATSITSPSLWRAVWNEAPDYFQAARQEFLNWIANINSQLGGQRKQLFWGSLALIVALYAPLAALARRFYARSKSVAEPTRFQKILGVWWIFLKVALPSVATVYIVQLLFDSFDLTNDRLQPFFTAITGGVLRVAFTAGLARGIFAPTRPNWRLPKFGDALSDKIVRLAIALAAIVSLTRIFEALNDLIGASLAFSVALRSLGVLLAAITLAIGLWGIGVESERDDCLGPQVTEHRDWFSLARILCWCVAVIDFAAVLGGYASFGSFVVDQLVWVSGIGCILFMSIALIDEMTAASFRPTTRIGRRLTISFGFHPNSVELIGALIAGMMRLALFTFAVFLILAPWGLQSSDVPLDFRAAFFGFKVGDVTVSLSSVAIAAGIFSLAYAIIHSVQSWIDARLLPHTSLDDGLRNSITTSLGYIGFLVALSLSLSYLGLSLEKLALLAGALSVGIGFGLQSIVNNFVSGLILLWERAVRVGDWIVVGSDQGYVRRINIRSTEIETFDRAQVIIPNSNLVSGIVKNLVRNDRTGRLVIPLTVAGAADPAKVREVLIAVAKSHDLVLKIPAPQILFTSMSASALTFDLAVFVVDVENLTRVRSDLHFEIFKRFKEEKFFVSAPPDPQKVLITGVQIDTPPPLSNEAEPEARNAANG